MSDKVLLCGIDEAGRGPLAGPLVIAGVVLSKEIEGLTDSKKLTPKRRELLYAQIIVTSKYHIVTFSPDTIDEKGLSYCISRGLMEIKSHLKGYSYLFDGNSKFGVTGIDTMVKADLKVKEVSAASILAKVTRDRMMEQFALEFPFYGFEKHKGYGTTLHVAMLKKYGRCSIHRKSFRVKALDEPRLF